MISSHFWTCDQVWVHLWGAFMTPIQEQKRPMYSACSTGWHCHISKRSSCLSSLLKICSCPYLLDTIHGNACSGAGKLGKLVTLQVTHAQLVRTGTTAPAAMHARRLHPQLSKDAGTWSLVTGGLTLLPPPLQPRTASTACSASAVEAGGGGGHAPVLPHGSSVQHPPAGCLDGCHRLLQVCRGVFRGDRHPA
jgi:hypothetical protein